MTWASATRPSSVSRPGVGLEVEGGAPLVAPDHLPVGRGAVAGVGQAERAGRVADAGALDLEDVGAEVGEVAGGARARRRRSPGRAPGCRPGVRARDDGTGRACVRASPRPSGTCSRAASFLLGRVRGCRAAPGWGGRARTGRCDGAGNRHVRRRCHRATQVPLPAPLPAPADAPDVSVEPFRLGYRPELDGVRGIAVLLVLTYHVGAVLWRDARFWLAPGGVLGLDVFFVLSGFLITSLLLDEADRRGRVAPRRLRRCGACGASCRRWWRLSAVPAGDLARRQDVRARRRPALVAHGVHVHPELGARLRVGRVRSATCGPSPSRRSSTWCGRWPWRWWCGSHAPCRTWRSPP